MDEQEEVQQNNMISNLPLLFANGYPTSLDKITESQLENFIPFMVQCSLGHINLQGKIDYSEPEWWPEDLMFYIPFTKPKRFSGNWIEKMKDVVVTCYQFHKSLFLLKFCTDLASYEHASLRFINNYNSTTSLFDRRSNKLLVTFRNENMSYDQPQRMRKCLLQQKSKNGRQIGQEQIMVEPAPFDIYLCDNCDAELYSKEAILEHEKTCNVDDDDVILCDTPEPEDSNATTSIGQHDASGSAEHNDEQRIAFLLNFNLQQCERSATNITVTSATTGVNSNRKSSNGGDVATSAASTAVSVPNATKEDSSGINSGFMIIDRNKRMPRRNRAVHSLTRCPTIPLSSPAGQMLLRTTKTLVSKEYLAERLDRLERFCQAPLLSKQSTKFKYLEKRPNTSTPHCTFKKPQDYSAHMYVFPRRQFSQRRRRQNFFFLNSSLLRRCRPISVRLKKITDREMSCKQRQDASSAKLNIKLTRDTSRSSNWKISPSTSANEIIVDTIDLCSSDEDDVVPNSEHSNIKCKQTSSHEPSTVATAVTTPKAATAKCPAEINAGTTAQLAIQTITSKALLITANDGAGSTAASNSIANVRSRACLKKIGSEISIIPIRKTLNSGGGGSSGVTTTTTTLTTTTSTTTTRVATPTLLKLVPTDSATAKEVRTKGGAAITVGKAVGGSTTTTNTTTFYDGSLRLAQSSSTTSLLATTANSSSITQQKPLRPVYILSNHPRNYPLTAIVTANDLVAAAAAVAAANANPTPIDATGSALRGQENQRVMPVTQAVRRQSFNAKRTATANMTAVTSTLLSTATLSTTSASAVASVNASPTAGDWYDAALEREHATTANTNTTTRNLTLMQSFGSPSRVISIDLTS